MERLRKGRTKETELKTESIITWLENIVWKVQIVQIVRDSSSLYL